MTAGELAAVSAGILDVGDRHAVEWWLRAVWDLRPDPGPSDAVVVYRGALLPRGLCVRYRRGQAIAAGAADG